MVDILGEGHCSDEEELLSRRCFLSLASAAVTASILLPGCDSDEDRAQKAAEELGIGDVHRRNMEKLDEEPDDIRTTREKVTSGANALLAAGHFFGFSALTWATPNDLEGPVVVTGIAAGAILAAANPDHASWFLGSTALFAGGWAIWFKDK